MRYVTPFLALAVSLACKSTAPYTVPAAVINTAIAVGASAQQRSEGGCFSTCARGTMCNPRTGYCEPLPCAGSCQAWEVCVENEVGWRCVAQTMPIVTEKRPASAAPAGGFVPNVGVSPATGTVPTLPPAKATPEAP